MDLAALIPIIISVGVSIGGALYARRRGLPALRIELDAATKTLIDTLKDQLALANADVTKLKAKLTAAEARIIILEAEVERLEKRVLTLLIQINEFERAQKRSATT